MIEDTLNPSYWESVPFHYWTVVFFMFGSIVGSFLNVCIHRMPLDQSVVNPGSHCPKCDYHIPWHLNIPLLSWLQLKGKCANCGIKIPIRYFLVELLTGLGFMSTWLAFGFTTPSVAIAMSLLLAIFIAATIIDIEHLIIPDEFTLGGAVVGIILSGIIPQMHGTESRVDAIIAAIIGAAIGAGVVYGLLWFGKLLFGRRVVNFEEGEETIIFSETAIHLDDEEIPFEELFYHASDTVILHASKVEMVDRCFWDAPVRLSQKALVIGKETFDPEPVKFLQVRTERITIPREAMGLGDVKFMGAIGAFLGWSGAVFSLIVSSMVGAVFGIALILGRKQKSMYIPYGPYIALAATIWIFLDPSLKTAWHDSIVDFFKIITGSSDFGS